MEAFECYGSFAPSNVMLDRENRRVLASVNQIVSYMDNQPQDKNANDERKHSHMLVMR